MNAPKKLIIDGVKVPCCLNCDFWARQELSKLGDLNLQYGICEISDEPKGKFETDHCDDHLWRLTYG
jgi:hypothetical protein